MSHETVSVLFILAFAAVGLVIFYYALQLVLGIINCYRERNHLREIVYSRKYLYEKNGRKTVDAMNEVERLRARIKTLEWSTQTHDLDMNELRQTYEDELARKDKIIENLNKSLEQRVKKAPAAATTEAGAEKDLAETKRPSHSTTK